MSIKNSLFELYFEFSDKIGPVLESGPLKYFGSGHWQEKYARENLDVIKEFEAEIKGMDERKVKELSKEVEKKLKSNNRNFWLCWLGIFGTSVVAGLEFIEYLSCNYNESLAFLVVPYIIFADEFACQSSIRKFHELHSGEEDVAAIIGPFASGLNSIPYFYQRHPELKENL